MFSDPVLCLFKANSYESKAAFSSIRNKKVKIYHQLCFKKKQKNPRCPVEGPPVMKPTAQNQHTRSFILPVRHWQKLQRVPIVWSTRGGGTLQNCGGPIPVFSREGETDPSGANNHRMRECRWRRLRIAPERLLDWFQALEWGTIAYSYIN